MTDHDNGDGFTQGGQQIKKADFALRINVGSWLIKKKQSWIGNQGSGHQDSLFLAARQLVRQVVKETFSSHSEGIISAAEFEPLATAIAQGKFKNQKRSPWLLDGVDCSLSFKYMQNGELKSEKYTSGGTCIYKDIFNKAHEIIDPYIDLWKNNAGENAKE